MAQRGDTNMGGDRRSFPSTHWTLVYVIRGAKTDERNSALKQLVELYWKPTYCWLRRSGYSDADAKDLVQEFFLSGLREGRIAKADPTRGRFRTFWLTCLKNFVANYKRDRKARGKQPSKPMARIDKFKTDDIALELVDSRTPEESFKSAWVWQLLLRVLKALKQECLKTGKELHYRLFRRRIIDPIFENKPQPAIKELAEEMGLTRKQASNYLITARRAYQRLLRAEIRMYASSHEEVALEVKDVFKFLGF
jgi:RNA polymerase sigma-70 factor (ECF subfamily)